MKVVSSVIIAVSILLLLISGIDTQCLNGTSTRREWRQLSPNEQDRFARAVIQMRSTGIFDRISNYHFQNSGLWHGTIDFLPVHRYLTLLFEQQLQRIDPSLDLPYWNWSLDSVRPEQSNIWRAFGLATRGGCIPNGYFAGWRANTPFEHCVSRELDSGNFGTEMVFASRNIIQSLTNIQDFSEFAETLEYGPHAQAHFAVGGDFARMFSTNDPLFYLHHAYVDLIFAQWQQKHTDQQFPRGQNYQLPATNGIRITQLWNIENLCYSYDALSQFRIQIPPRENENLVIYPRPLPSTFLRGMCYPEDKVRAVEVKLRSHFIQIQAL